MAQNWSHEQTGTPPEEVLVAVVFDGPVVLAELPVPPEPPPPTSTTTLPPHAAGKAEASATGSIAARSLRKGGVGRFIRASR